MVGLIATSVCWLAVVALAAYVWWPGRESPDDVVAVADNREWWRA
jgi:hypothetical protein